MIREIAPNVFAVGVADPDRRHFHGHEMSTAQGTTYNSYLIRDTKEIVLVDTVWPAFTDEFVANIRQVVDPARITTIVCNHAEPDHGGSLAAIKQLAPNAQILCSKRGTESITGWHHADWPLKIVETGQTLDTGTMKLTFIMALMCHWPDSMMVHVGGADGPNILLSNDAFGQHYTAAVFDDQVADGQLWFEAKKYFVNIITPYCRNVTQRLDELDKAGLPPAMIAPAHGVIWRQGVAAVLAAYRRWSAQQTQQRVVVCYDTMYESTRRLADAICDGVADEGLPLTRHHLGVSDQSDVVTDMFGARGYLIGSPVWHMTVLPSVASLLDTLKALAFKGRMAGAFGSFGWQKVNVPVIEERAKVAGIEVPLPGVICQWKPREADLAAARDFGRQFGQKVKQ